MLKKLISIYIYISTLNNVAQSYQGLLENDHDFLWNGASELKLHLYFCNKMHVKGPVSEIDSRPIIGFKVLNYQVVLKKYCWNYIYRQWSQVKYGFLQREEKEWFFSTLNNKCANRIIKMKSWGPNEWNFHVCTRVFDFRSKPATTLLFSSCRMISVRAVPTAEAADTPQDSLTNAIWW